MLIAVIVFASLMFLLYKLPSWWTFGFISLLPALAIIGGYQQGELVAALGYGVLFWAVALLIIIDRKRSQRQAPGDQ
jgi:hypothetical protein